MGAAYSALPPIRRLTLSLLKYKPLIAVRNPTDLKSALDRAVQYVARFGVEYQRTLRYVLAELLYNAGEHGRRDFVWRGRHLTTPAILQFSLVRTGK